MSGSDAHSHDLDRVVLSFAPPPGCPVEAVRPGHLLAAMLAEEEHPDGEPASEPTRRPDPRAHALTAAPRVAPLGTPASPARQLADILAVIGRNLALNAPCFTPRTLAGSIVRCAAITRDALRKRAARQQQLTRALREDFDPEALLPFLRFPETAGLPASARERAHAVVAPS
jgi:hypothetical protein